MYDLQKNEPFSDMKDRFSSSEAVSHSGLLVISHSIICSHSRKIVYNSTIMWQHHNMGLVSTCFPNYFRLVIL